MTQEERLEREETPWHSLDVAEVARRLETSEHGLSTAEARARFEHYGSNELPEEPPPHPLAVLLRQFKSPLIFILLIAAGVAVLLEEFIDGAVIAAVLVLNAVIGFTQERRAEASVRALSKLMAPHATARRDGEEQELVARELVPGDVVLLESGDRVPADIRLAVTNALRIDESLLTGESIPVSKHREPLEGDLQAADRTNMALSGTIVTSGRGHGFVVATGTHTEIGAIAGFVRGTEIGRTPLEERMAAFARIIGLAVLAAALVALGAGALRGQGLHDMFLVAVGIAVAAIPEGLPVVLTITLALGVWRMAQRQAILRRLAAVSTLGSTTVIASDKTGTLTENRMVVQQLWSAGHGYDLKGDGRAELLRDGRPVELAEHQPLYLTLLAGVLTNEASLHDGEHGPRGQGDPTEVALLRSAASAGVEPERCRDAYEVVAELPFEPDRAYSVSVRRHEGRTYLFLKGAPERVLDMCEQMLLDEGTGALDREAAIAGADAMAGEGLRVLGMAYLPIENGEDHPDLLDPRGLVFVGMQGMLDPPRAGVRDAIERCHAAGLRVVMVTGDHAGTAAAIASRLGINPGESRVVEGREIEDTSDEDLRRVTVESSVFARVSPEHKLRIVRALRANGEVVSVTGDGVNDAPALRAADIGIAMGRDGTDVARQAADMVLADDNFVTIVAAIEEGRNIFKNVRLVTFFLVSTGAALIATMLTALFLGWPIAMLPTQLLWLNLVTNGLQDVALAFEPGEKGVMRRPPRPLKEGILSGLLWERTLVVGVVMAVGTLVMFRIELDRTGSEELARTAALTTMVLFQAAHLGNSRSEFLSAFAKSPLSNRFLLIATSGALTVHAVALYLAPTQYILRVEPIRLETWLAAAAVALTVILAGEIHKLLRNPPREREVNHEAAVRAAT